MERATECAQLQNVLKQPITNIKLHLILNNKVYSSPKQYIYLQYLLFSHIKKDNCDCQNVSVKLLYVYVCLSTGHLLIFSIRVSSFFSFFCLIHTLILSLSMFIYVLHSFMKIMFLTLCARYLN